MTYIFFEACVLETRRKGRTGHVANITMHNKFIRET